MERNWKNECTESLLYTSYSFLVWVIFGGNFTFSLVEKSSCLSSLLMLILFECNLYKIALSRVKSLCTFLLTYLVNFVKAIFFTVYICSGKKVNKIFTFVLKEVIYHSRKMRDSYATKLKPYSIVLVDLNEFPLIFQKVQHSHSRNQKTTSRTPYNQFKRHIKIQWNMATRGSYVHNITLWQIFRGASRKSKFYAIFPENWWFQKKRFAGLFELIQIYKQNSLEKFFTYSYTI